MRFLCSVVHKSHTVKQRNYQSILQKISKSSEGMTVNVQKTSPIPIESE